VNSPQKFVEAAEALAEAFESAGRTDLAAFCDRASYWLSGGNGLELISLSEMVESCTATLSEALKTEKSRKEFIARTAEEITENLREIGSSVVTAARETDSEDLIDRAAKLQAISILISGLFKRG